MPASHQLIPLLLPPGMARNGSAWDTPGRFWDMNLFRWLAGTLRPVGGWERMTQAPLDSPVRKLFAWRSNQIDQSLMFGTDHKLYVNKATDEFIDITPAGFIPPSVSLAGGYGTGPYGKDFYGTPRDPSVVGQAFSNFAYWSMDNWGEDIVLTANTDGNLWYYTHNNVTPVAPVKIVGTKPAGTPQQPPTSVAAVIVTNERHVMAIGGSIGGTYYPNRIFWSSSEDTTDWDFASLTNSAGFLDLKTTSPLMCAVHVREGILVFSTTEIFLITYVGGPFYYGQIKLGEMQMMNPYSIAEVMGTAFWPTPRGFHFYTAGYIQPLNCEFFDSILDEVDDVWAPLRVCSGGHGMYAEIWFFYPTTGNTENNKYVIFNPADGWFTWGYLGRTAIQMAGVYLQPIMGGTDKHLYVHEKGWTNAGLPILFDRYIETGALGIQDGTNTVEVHQALLAADTPGAFRIEFFSRFAPNGAEFHFGPYSERPDGYTDTRVSAREARVRWTMTVDANVSLGKTRLAVRGAGTR